MTWRRCNRSFDSAVLIKPFSVCFNVRGASLSVHVITACLFPLPHLPALDGDSVVEATSFHQLYFKPFFKSIPSPINKIKRKKNCGRDMLTCKKGQLKGLDYSAVKTEAVRFNLDQSSSSIYSPSLPFDS